MLPKSDHFLSVTDASKALGVARKTILDWRRNGVLPAAKRDVLYRGGMSFAKFLVQEGLMDKTVPESLKPLRPKRHLPPKRITVSSENLSNRHGSSFAPASQYYRA